MISDLPQKFVLEIKKSLIIEEPDKKFWQENIDFVPVFLLENFYEILKQTNDKIDEYIKTALKSDPEYLTGLKNLVKKLKKDVLTFSEVQEVKKENADELLEEKLKNL